MSCFTEDSQNLKEVDNSRGVIRDLLTILTQPFQKYNGTHQSEICGFSPHQPNVFGFPTRPQGLLLKTS